MLIEALCFLFLNFGSISSQDVPVTPGRQEIQMSISAKKPGILIPEISDAIYVFIPNTDTDGIAISCFPRLIISSAIPTYLKNCTIFLESEKNTAVTDLYELGSRFWNTIVFNESVGINCRGVNTTNMGIVVQDGRQIRPFDNHYYMIDLDVINVQGLQSYYSKGMKAAFTTVSFNGALTRIDSAIYASNQKYFSVSDSTPEKPGQIWVSEKYTLPATYMTSNTLFTTFFFDDVEVIVRVLSDQKSKVCDDAANVFQEDNLFYIYPPEAQLTQSTFSGDIFCEWNFIAMDNYYIQFTLLGALETSSQITIRDKRGTGIFFSSDYSTSPDYKGSFLNTTFSLPSTGTLRLNSMLGTGSFSFKAEFLLFDANKPVETRVLGTNDSSYLINMNVLQTKQFFFDTSSLSSTFQLGIYAAPSYIHRSYIQDLDDCFVETNDANGGMERFSLRSSFECGTPRMFKSVLVSCMGDNILDGYLLVNGYENSSIATIGEACARMASSLKSFAISGTDPSLNQLTALMVIEDDTVDTVSLINMRKNGTDPLIVINGGIFGEQIANISDNSDLPFYTQKKLVTYRLPSSSAAVLNFTVLGMNPFPINDNYSKKVNLLPSILFLFALMLKGNAEF